MSDLFLTEEEKLLQNMVRDFSEQELAPKADELDSTQEFPWEAMKAMGDLGLFGVGVDPEYGGTGGGARELAIVAEELTRCCGATSLTWIAHVSLAIQNIHGFANDAQKKKYLPELISGEKIGAFGLSEPGMGSDAAALQTSAKKTDGSYLINGSKTWITNGDFADTCVVYATMDPEKRSRGITAFIVEREFGGLEAQSLGTKMGMRASDTAQVFLQDVPVPQENLMGAEGEGFKIAMLTLDSSRITIAAQAVGFAQAALEAAIQYSKQRKSFGVPISDHQGIQFKLAEMATRVEASRLMVRNAAMLRDAGLPFIKEACMAKFYASASATYCTNEAVQVHGGIGYFKPTLVERLYRDAKVTEIYEGTSEVQRMVIARHVLGKMGG